MTTTTLPREFDRICVENASTLTAEMSDKEFADVSTQAIAEVRALGLPDQMTDEAEAMLEGIEATTTDPNLTDEQIIEYDDQFLTAAEAVGGLSDACIGGAPG